MAFCRSCGSELREGNSFCMKCGARAGEESSEQLNLSSMTVAQSDSVVPPVVPSNSQAFKPASNNGSEFDGIQEAAKMIGGALAGASSFAKKVSGEAKTVAEEVKRSYEEAGAKGEAILRGADERLADTLPARADVASEQIPDALTADDEKLDSINPVERKVINNEVNAKPANEEPFAHEGYSGEGVKNVEALENKDSDSGKKVKERSGNKGLIIFVAVLALMLVCASAFLILNSNKSSSGNGASGDSSSAVTAPVAKTYTTHIKVSCDKNLIFSTYDVQIYVDDELIATLDHGAEGTWDKELTEGSHEFKVCKKGDKKVDGTKTFAVTAECSIDCRVATTSSQVEIKEFSCLTKGEQEQKAAEEKAAEEKAEAEAKQKEEEEAKQKEEQAAKKAAEEAENSVVLTVDNCDDLATLLSSNSTDASAFASKYKGRTIEFDGNIAYMSPSGSSKTRYRLAIAAGDYNPDSQKGPNMRFDDVNFSNMHVTGADSVATGMNFRITAKVGSYNSTQDILNLTPVSMVAR